MRITYGASSESKTRSRLGYEWRNSASQEDNHCNSSEERIVLTVWNQTTNTQPSVIHQFNSPTLPSLEIDDL